MRRTVLFVLTAAAFVMPACSDYRDTGATPEQSGALNVSAAESTISRFKAEDPSLSKFFDSAYGWAVFPKVTKGGAGIGAAHGKNGVVWEQGRVVGSAELTQISAGLQLGGQSFAELIFFQDKATLDRFKAGQTKFSANASAVAASSGAAAASDFADGVAVFTMPLGGLMFEASIGGQEFDFFAR